ncbi:MAG: WecB/TagA/CpsF family glycosyltransferase [Geodermatophilaceae bacterium]|nr:WecB/TagA/CpsF family glycosyltransferase [Geodermatophilaceae bacterium]MDQ3456851.1 WecB/TagA/CpsF family glycosyltransferase [Actinomycetota bacterium]
MLLTAARVPVGPLDFDPLTEDDVVSRVAEAVDRGRGGWISTPNIDILRRSARETSVRNLLGSADIVVADGAPVVWAARLTGRPLPGRVAGSSLLWSLCTAAASGGYGIYLLGGEPGVAERAARRLMTHAPGLQVTGTCAPAWGFETRPAEVEAIRARLIAADPKIVFVGLGCPKQERLIAALSESLPGAWWIGCGAALDFAAGQLRRAPRWMQRSGLEWVHRMAAEPGRLVRRYVVEDAPYALRLLVASARRRAT